MWGATFLLLEEEKYVQISIHAPRVGSDGESRGAGGDLRHFNPRSPCGERLRLVVSENDKELFQSTLPVWGATMALLSTYQKFKISIHAPRVGGDT